MIKAKGSSEYQEMREINDQVFENLEQAFAHFNIQLIDFKLEYGLIDDQVTLIDEITGGSFRLWPYASDNPNLNQSNVLAELNPKGRLDKDNYRMGGDLSSVKTKFAAIADITAGFKDLGSIYENLVFLKIKRQNPKYLKKNGIEIDFKTKDALIEAKYKREIDKKQKELFDNIKVKKKILADGFNFFKD